jgi:hypothetical protein
MWYAWERRELRSFGGKTFKGREHFEDLNDGMRIILK